MKLYPLENEHFMVELLDVGASLYAFRLKAKENRNIVLNTADLANYRGPENAYFGASVGPVAGRIPNGKLVIDGKRYQLDRNEKGSNTLHGGHASFAFKTFNVISHHHNEIIFRLLTQENEGGFPGVLRVDVTYRLQADTLEVSYDVIPSKKSILNVTNHSYFNLDGEGTILDHQLKVLASDYYILDDLQINRRPQKIKPGTLFDFKKPKALKEVVLNPKINTPPTMGLDHLLFVPDGALILEGRDAILTVHSDAPAFQLYSTNFPPLLKGENGKDIALYQGLAIEPVSVVAGTTGKYPHLEVRPGETYKRIISYQIRMKA